MLHFEDVYLQKLFLTRTDLQRNVLGVEQWRRDRNLSRPNSFVSIWLISRDMNGGVWTDGIGQIDRVGKGKGEGGLTIS